MENAKLVSTLHLPQILHLKRDDCHAFVVCSQYIQHIDLCYLMCLLHDWIQLSLVKHRENCAGTDNVDHVVQYETAIKKWYYQFHHELESRQRDNSTGGLCYCLRLSKFICINALYLPLLGPNCLWSLTLDARENVKNVRSLSAAPQNPQSHLLLIKTRRSKHTYQTRIRERKITSAVKPPLLRLFCDSPLVNREEGTSGGGEHLCPGIWERLVRMADDKRQDAACPLGGFIVAL